MLNGLPPINPKVFHMHDQKKPKYYPDYKNILKQAHSNHNLSGKKAPIYKKNIHDHKKNYVSPYSQKAIQKA